MQLIKTRFATYNIKYKYWFSVDGSARGNDIKSFNKYLEDCKNKEQFELLLKEKRNGR